MEKFKLGIVGYGNMAKAICEGVLKSKVLYASQIAAFDIDQAKCNLAKEKGLFIFPSIRSVAENSEFIMLCIKPQTLREISVDFSKNKIISILAGTTIERLKKLKCKKIARVMPNAPAMVGKGAAAVTYYGMDENEKQFVNGIFSSVGICTEIEESVQNAVTATSGSGPAYVYYFINSMIEGAKKIGLDENIAKTLVLKTFEGAVETAKNSELTFSQQIEFVSSKGGTTEQAISTFNKNGLDKIIEEAMKNCYKRAEELSE